VPVALKGCAVPSGIDGCSGVTLIDTRAAGATVRVVVPEIPETVAPIDVVPVATAVATPAASIDATEGMDDDQEAVAVTSCVLLSVNVPVAVKPCVNPLASVGLDGVMAMLTNSAAVTLSVADPLIAPEDAVIIAEPTCVPVASPLGLIVAALLDDDHVTLAVKSTVLPSV
jgi:hypothetical protein